MVRALPAILLLALLLAPAGAEEAERGPGEAALARLREQKVLATSEQFGSVASPYKSPDFPYFITSDSVIAAYQSLLLESVGRIEWTRIEALPGALQGVHARLPEAAAAATLDPALVARAERRARIVLATALTLLTAAQREDDEEILAIARAEADRVVAVQEDVLPKWLGPPDADFRIIDYSRFRVNDVDAAVPRIARGQRAIRWLSFLPFRIGREEEFLAFLLLRLAAERTPEAAEAFAGYPVLLGPGEEMALLDPRLAVPAKITPAVFAGLTRIALGLAPPEPVRDRAMDPGHRPEATVRLLPLAAPACAHLLQAVSDRSVAAGGPTLPSALAVGAALGSPVAREALDETARAAVEAARDFASGPSHYDRYLGCLALLNAPPDERAPAFLRGPVWRLKTLQTTLSGWTLLRHAWSTRIKSTMAYFGSRDAAGFVEPAPKFYRALAGLARDTGERTQALGASEGSYAVFAKIAEYHAVAELLEEFGFERLTADLNSEGWKEFWTRAWQDPVLRRRGDSVWLLVSREFWEDARRPPSDSKEFARRVEKLRDRAVELRDTGQLELPWRGDPWVPVATPLAPRWKLLAEVLDELSALAEAELAGRAFTPEEEEWIRAYGQALADILDEPKTGPPTDDAFAAVTVFTDPVTGRCRVEAVGRPRAIYVLWPRGEEEILCRGAVLPWHERTEEGPLGDEDWRRRLDAEPRPRPHEILRDLYEE